MQKELEPENKTSGDELQLLQVMPAEGAGVHFPCLPRCPELSLAQKQSSLASISVVISRMPFYYLPSQNI